MTHLVYWFACIVLYFAGCLAEESAAQRPVQSGALIYSSTEECCRESCANRGALSSSCTHVASCSFFEQQTTKSDCCSGGCSCEWTYKQPSACPQISDTLQEDAPCKRMQDYDTNGNCMHEGSKRGKQGDTVMFLLLYYGLPFAAFATGLHVLCCLRRMNQRASNHNNGQWSTRERVDRGFPAHSTRDFSEMGQLGALAVGPQSDLLTEAETREAFPFALRLKGDIVPAAVWKDLDTPY
mmetsp:Transcript_28623/g.42049  ORF Transcript_28623/g.42049 Transcript_28623/m.42049 type:complete len:239 (+) Transcript_28623:43-759(+)